MVSCWVLLTVGKHRQDQTHCHRDCPLPGRLGQNTSWVPQYQPHPDRREISKQGPCGNAVIQGTGRHGHLLPTKAGAVGTLNVDHGLTSPRGGVPAGLPPGQQPEDVLKRRGQGPPPQQQLLYHPGMPIKLNPPRKQELPRELKKNYL